MIIISNKCSDYINLCNSFIVLHNKSIKLKPLFLLKYKVVQGHLVSPLNKHLFVVVNCLVGIFLFLVLYVFLTPPALPEVSEAWYNVRRTYFISSLTFKRVTRGSSSLHYSILLLFFTFPTIEYVRRALSFLSVTK